MSEICTPFSTLKSPLIEIPRSADNFDRLFILILEFVLQFQLW